MTSKRALDAGLVRYQAQHKAAGRAEAFLASHRRGWNNPAFSATKRPPRGKS